MVVGLHLVEGCVIGCGLFHKVRDLDWFMTGSRCWIFAFLDDIILAIRSDPGISIGS